MKFIISILLLFTQTAIAQQQSKKQSFNPDISLNSLFLYQNSSRGNDSTSDPKNGFSLDEAEFIFSSDIDVYAKIFGAFGLHKEGSSWKFEPEELYAESLNLPQITIRAGKMYATLGKYNAYHKHALPFINANLINKELLGDEGFNEVGISAAYLIPAAWFSEITLQALNPSTTPYSATQANGTALIGKFKNLFDLTDSSTLELSASGATGPNELDKKTNIFGGDFTFKWRPTQGGKYSALIWSTEYLNATKEDNNSGGTKTSGLTSFIQWQFAERWWLQARNEHYSQKVGSADAEPKRRNSALIAFVPTEFTALRLQYDRTEATTYEVAENKILLQLNMTIGSHPAHSY